MIHRVAADQVTPDLIRKFKREAEAIATAGAADFGGNRGGAFFFRTRHSMGQISIDGSSIDGSSIDGSHQSMGQILIFVVNLASMSRYHFRTLESLSIF